MKSDVVSLKFLRFTPSGCIDNVSVWVECSVPLPGGVWVRTWRWCLLSPPGSPGALGSPAPEVPGSPAPGAPKSPGPAAVLGFRYLSFLLRVLISDSC